MLSVLLRSWRPAGKGSDMARECETEKETRSIRTGLILITIQAILLLAGTFYNSPTADEMGHLVAGISYFRTGRFGLYNVNPPPLKLYASLPAILLGYRGNDAVFTSSRHYRLEDVHDIEFMRENGTWALWLVTFGRWLHIPITLAGGWVCFRWGRELWGANAGLLACALWTFSPSVIAYGNLMTPDIPAAVAGLYASYTFWQWLRQPSWETTFYAANALGIAQVTKTTWVLLFLVWPFLWAVCECVASYGRWRKYPNAFFHGPERPKDSPIIGLCRRMAQVSAMLVAGLLAINIAYAFEDSGKPLGDFEFVSESLTGTPLNDRAQGRTMESGNRFKGTCLAPLKMPLPENYILGIDLQRRDFESPWLSYLRGEFRRSGWCWYYIYGLLVKESVTTLGLAALTIGAVFWSGYRAHFIDELVLLIPALVIAVLVSSQIRMNIHFRYILPVLPLAYISIGRLARPTQRGNLVLSTVAKLFALLGACSMLLIFPYELSYFNELAGGPMNGTAHLHGSATDWGQGVYALRRWCAAHPQAQPLFISRVPHSIDPALLGISYQQSPPLLPDLSVIGRSERVSYLDSNIRPGWYAISVNEWVEKKRELRYLQSLTPIATVGYTFVIFYLSSEDAVCIRNDYLAGKDR